MGRYISQSDVETRWGAENVRTWSNLDNDSETTDTARVAAAIAWAEEQVESRFVGSRYVVPLVGLAGTPATLTNWCATLAGIWLYRGRLRRNANLLADLEEEESRLDAEIALYQAGKRNLPCQVARTMPSAPEVVG